MRIAYISPTFLSDVDLSLLNDLQSKVDVDYYLQISPFILKNAAVCINKQNVKNGVLDVSDYPELEQFTRVIDKDKFYIVNDTGHHSYSIRSFFCYFHLLIKLLCGKYDVIHFTWPFTKAGYIMYFLRKKMIMTVHDPFPHSSNDDSYNRSVRKVAFRAVHNFILLNLQQKEDFIDYYQLQKKKVFNSSLGCYSYLHIYNSTENTYFEDLKPGYILMFGNILSHKGADYLLEAMELVHKTIPSAKLVVAGRWKWNYDKYDYFKNKSFIHLIDKFIPDSSLAQLIRSSSICVTPYLDATQSGVIMSAFAYNKPCIATNVGGLPEMVVDKKFGKIVPPKNIDALANSIIELLHDHNLLCDYKYNIKNEYELGNKSWNIISDKLIDIYKEII